ncbi:MAG: hypothetical protein ACRES8_00030, partial [Nevskiaceae bacterium]
MLRMISSFPRKRESSVFLLLALTLLLAACAALPGGGRATVDDAFRRSAQQLDSEVHRWLRDQGVTRKDGTSVYAMDLAPLLLHAAQAGDRELYLKVHAGVQPLILTEQSGTYSAGFVLWRRAKDLAPEISGATEAIWTARALMAGAGAFDRPTDRA